MPCKPVGCLVLGGTRRLTFLCAAAQKCYGLGSKLVQGAMGRCQPLQCHLPGVLDQVGRLARLHTCLLRAWQTSPVLTWAHHAGMIGLTISTLAVISSCVWL